MVLSLCVSALNAYHNTSRGFFQIVNWKMKGADIKRDLNCKIKNGDGNNELDFMKIIMKSCKENMINSQQIKSYFEMIKLAIQIDDDDDRESPGL